MLEFKKRLSTIEKLSPEQIFKESNKSIIITGTGNNYESKLCNLLSSSLKKSVLTCDEVLCWSSTDCVVIICLRHCGFTTKVKKVIRETFGNQIPLAIVFTDDSFSLRSRGEIENCVEKIKAEVAEELVFNENKLSPFIYESLDVRMLDNNPELFNDGDNYGKPMRALSKIIQSHANHNFVEIEGTDKLLYEVGIFIDQVLVSLLDEISKLSLAKPLSKIEIKKLVSGTAEAHQSLSQVIIKALPIDQRGAARSIILSNSLSVQSVLETTINSTRGRMVEIMQLKYYKDDVRSYFVEMIINYIMHAKTYIFETLLEN